MGFSIEGLTETRQMLQNVPTSAGEIAKGGRVKQSVRKMESDIKSNVPVATGKLRNSVSCKLIIKQNSVILRTEASRAFVPQNRRHKFYSNALGTFINDLAKNVQKDMK